MASDISTIQSLKAVDAWIDVINANINGGVRTAFKSSRLKFAGSNATVDRAGTSTSLPLQFPEPGLTTANTVIDFGQGAVTASTENSHLAIQGEGFFAIVSPACMGTDGEVDNALVTAGNASLYLTRDGEFRTNKDGLLVNAAGYFLVTGNVSGAGASLTSQPVRAVYNDLDNPTATTTVVNAVKLSVYLQGIYGDGAIDYIGGLAGGGNWNNVPVNTSSLVKVTLGRQSLQYTSLGSTIFDFGYRAGAANGFASIALVSASSADATLLSKSLEASNASMTQSVPELSLAQKLFSALTKVLQTKQTNVDGVLNLVR